MVSLKSTQAGLRVWLLIGVDFLLDTTRHFSARNLCGWLLRYDFLARKYNSSWAKAETNAIILEQRGWIVCRSAESAPLSRLYFTLLCRASLDCISRNSWRPSSQQTFLSNDVLQWYLNCKPYFETRHTKNRIRTQTEKCEYKWRSHFLTRVTRCAECYFTLKCGNELRESTFTRRQFVKLSSVIIFHDPENSWFVGQNAIIY